MSYDSRSKVYKAVKTSFEGALKSLEIKGKQTEEQAAK
jgi:hypothetical protein